MMENKLTPQETLSDEEMDQVTGGVKLPPGQVETPVTGRTCPKCNSTDILKITSPYFMTKYYCQSCHYCE